MRSVTGNKKFGKIRDVVQENTPHDPPLHRFVVKRKAHGLLDGVWMIGIHQSLRKGYVIQSSREALAGDWRAVGKDMRTVMSRKDAEVEAA